MKKPSKTEVVVRRPTKAQLASDPSLKEFWEKDLGPDLKHGVVMRSISLRLDDDLVAALRRAGAKRGLGYQTMLRVIAKEHVADYLR